MDAMNLIVAMPELILVVSVPLILVADLFLPQGRRDVTFVLSSLVILACAAASAMFMQDDTVAYAFGGSFVSDAVSKLLKLCTCFAMLLTLIYARRYVNERQMTSGHLGGEFYTLALFSMLGQFVVISAADFLVMFLGIELMSFPLYALVALKRDDGKAVEAATKFFILGALGSGLLLYGISMLYGATGSLGFAEVAKMAAQTGTNRLIMVFGIVFVVAGIAFKLGAVPFHMWVPDVFEGAPTAVTLLVGGAPKLAGFAVCMRVLVDGLLPMAVDWQQMLVVVSVLSMALGNVMAIMQSNIKRMLAYSTISQMGYMLLGMLAGVKEGGVGTTFVFAYGASMYYTIVYVLATLGAFGVIIMMSQKGFEAEKLSDFPGTEPPESLVCAHHAFVHVFIRWRSAAGRLLRQGRGISGGHQCRSVLAGGRRHFLCRRRCGVLSAGCQDHVFRCAAGYRKNRGATGYGGLSRYQWRAGAGARRFPGAVDGLVSECGASCVPDTVMSAIFFGAGC